MKSLNILVLTLIYLVVFYITKHWWINLLITFILTYIVNDFKIKKFNGFTPFCAGFLAWFLPSVYYIYFSNGFMQIRIANLFHFPNSYLLLTVVSLFYGLLCSLVFLSSLNFLNLFKKDKYRYKILK